MVCMRDKARGGSQMSGMWMVSAKARGGSQMSGDAGALSARLRH